MVVPGSHGILSSYLTLTVFFGAAALTAGNDDESRHRRVDDMLNSEIAALLQTHAQQIAELRAESTALKNHLAASQLQLGKCSTTAYFTAHITHSSPAHGQAILFDVVQTDSANAYDATQRAYVIPITGIYWVHVIADVVSEGARATLELYADKELLGSANAADASDAAYGGAFRFQRGQKLIVRRANNDGYLPGNPLKGRTSFSVVLVRAL